jgi:hypothetical protein
MENQKIEIPEKFKVIAVRGNRGNESPMGFSEKFNGEGYKWTDSGPAYPNTNKHGLYGILLSQELTHLELIANYVPYPNYLILEVDKRKITGESDFQKRTHLESIEVEFPECNVIFKGQLPEFLERLKEYATPPEFKKISDVLSQSLKEIIESRESPEKAKEYVLRIKNRAETEQAKEALQKGRDLLKQMQSQRKVTQI